MTATLDTTTAQNTLSADVFPFSLNVSLRPETQELITLAKTMVRTDTKITIKSQDEYDVAADQLGKVQTAAKSIDTQRKELTKPLDDRKKVVMDYFRPLNEGLDATVQLLKAGMLAFEDEQERKRLAEQARAEEAARKQREKLLDRAEAEDEKGNSERAEALMQQAETIVAAPVTQVVRAAGTSRREVWAGQVNDLEKLVLAVAAPLLLRKLANECKGEPAALINLLMLEGSTNPVPLAALMGNPEVITAQAKAMKDQLNWPGVAVSKSTSMTSRARA